MLDAISVVVITVHNNTLIPKLESLLINIKSTLKRIEHDYAFVFWL